MPGWLALALLAGGAVGALAWLAVLIDPARAWRLRPVAEEEPEAPAPAHWPHVRVIIPARNEASVLREALPTVMAQDYPGDWGVVFVDERSTDATAAVAAHVSTESSAASHFQLVSGEAVPAGWVGKVWGLEQGHRVARPAAPDYYLLTDADIAHAAESLRKLVAEAEGLGLALNSRMARLRCESWAERLLIPAFVFFFNLLYPMRRVNDPASGVAACAGGCVLLRASALDTIGGFERIRGELIDDVNLARAVKLEGGRIRLAVSRADVRSLRRYATVGPIWRMVRRTAFDELGYSWLRLAGTVAGMLLLFALAPLLVLAAAALGGATAAGALSVAPWQLASIGVVGAVALMLMRAAYRPATTLFELGSAWAWTLSAAGTIYGLITLDSAWQHLRGRRRAW